MVLRKDTMQVHKSKLQMPNGNKIPEHNDFV